MGYQYVTVTDQSGAINLLYASITWSGSSGSTTVYVNIEGVHSAGAAWRVRKGTSTPLQGSGIGEKTFTGTIGETYQLQAVDPNTSNWAWYGGNFTLTADSSSGGDDGGDSGGDSGGSSGGTTTPSLPNVSTTQSVYAFIDNGSVWIPVGADAASLGLAKVSQTEIAYALVDSGSSWLPINY